MPTQHTRKIGRITHQWGSTIMPVLDPDTGLVTTLLVERGGERTNAYVTELRPNEDTIFLEGPGITPEQASSAYILSLLKDENPGYRRHRSAFFVEKEFSDDGTRYETTRLRADLYTAVASQRPDLFKPEELANLPEHVFRKYMTDRPAEISPENLDGWKLDFSRETVKGVASYIREKSIEADAWRYSGLSPVYRWLNGDAIHPIHNSRKSEQIKNIPIADLAEDVVVIAKALGADDLTMRASEVADTERRATGDDYAKRGSPYFEIVDAHSSAVRDMRGIMRDVKDGKHSDGQKKHKKGRVHEEMPEWKLRVLEKLEPMLENKVVGSRFYGFDLVESPERGEVTDSRGHGLPVRVLTTTDEERARKAYASTGIKQAPSRRPDSLRASLFRSYELLGEIYRAAVPFYIQDIKEDPSGRIQILPRNVNTTFSHFRTNDGSTMVCVPIDDFKYLSPALVYSHTRLVGMWEQWMRLLGTAKNDRDFRREFMRTLNSHLPDKHPSADMLNQAYSSSALLKRLFDTEKRFAREITTGMRRVDERELDGVIMLSPERFKTTHRLAGEKYKALTDIFSEIDRACADPIKELKRLDAQMPSDVTLFRLFPRSMSAGLDTLNTHERERGMFRQIVSMYGVDPPEAAAAYEDEVLKSAQATHGRIRDLREKNHVKGRMIFALADLAGRNIQTVEI